MTEKTPRWLDNIVEPTVLSLRADIPRTVITKRFVDHQVKRLLDIVAFANAGKFASAAHTLKEHRANNPWLKDK